MIGISEIIVFNIISLILLVLILRLLFKLKWN